MKKILLILLTIFVTNSVWGQITKTKIATKKAAVVDTPYDSLKNFLGKEVYKYIGQELYLPEMSEDLRKYGYEGFMIDYQGLGQSNTYKCCDDYSYRNSKYDELKDKYFIVIDVHKHPEAEKNQVYGDTYYLELEEKKSKDKVYFKYRADFEPYFPFIVVGFYKKQKKLLIGQEFVFTDEILKISSGNGMNITTGKLLVIKTGEKWKCKDLTIEERFYSLSLVVKNPRGETTTISHNAIFSDERYVYTEKEADKYKNKFGIEKFNLILRGKVEIGMTKEMCELSWGKPNNINKTITSNITREQWVYDNKYLYFDNNKLTAIQ